MKKKEKKKKKENIKNATEQIESKISTEKKQTRV